MKRLLLILLLSPLLSFGQMFGALGYYYVAPVSSSTIAPVFTKTVTGTGVVTTTTVNATSATQVFVGVAYRRQAAAPVAIQDNGFHSWTVVRQNESGIDNYAGAIIYEAHGSFGAAMTVTVTCNLCGIGVNGFSGTTATTVDQANGVVNFTAGTGDSPGSITTTRSNNVIMSVFHNVGNTVNPALPSGWTDGGYFPFGSTFPARVIYQVNNGGTSTVNPVFTVSAAAGNDAVIQGDE